MGIILDKDTYAGVFPYTANKLLLTVAAETYTLLSTVAVGLTSVPVGVKFVSCK